MKTSKQHSILLFANGEVTSREVSRVRSQTFDAVFAANGGSWNALRFGITPDVVVGDLDSITPAMRSRMPKTRFEHHTSQDINDLHKALLHCVENGVTRVTALGIIGKRFDHTLNNFSVLFRFDQQMQLTILDAYSQIYIVRDQWEYPGQVGQTVSLIPVGQAEGVNTRGLRWALKDEPLAMGSREGCSNEIISSPVRVTIQKGILLAFAKNSKDNGNNR